MKQKQKILGLFLIAMGLVLPRNASAVMVTTADMKDIATQIEAFAKGVEEVVTEVETLVKSTKELIDVGDLMNQFFDIGFLIPKPKMSTDVVETIPKSGDSKKGVSASSITGGLGGKKDGEKFEDAKKVNSSVKKNLTVAKSGDDSEEDSESFMDMAKDLATSISGADGQGPKAEEVTKARAKLLQSKQAFARYALSAALVHRTLAHRTSEESKENTSNKTQEATSQRKVHSAKVHSNLMMADTYNRLLMSQAAANGLSAFTAREEMESKIDYNLRGVTDGVGLGGGLMGAGMGNLGGVGAVLGM